MRPVAWLHAEPRVSANSESLARTTLNAMHQLQIPFLLWVFAGWVNRRQQDVIAYLREENRVLREQLGGRRIRFNDVQRRRLAQRAKRVGRRGLFEVATLVAPDTLPRAADHGVHRTQVLRRGATSQPQRDQANPSRERLRPRCVSPTRDVLAGVSRGAVGEEACPPSIVATDLFRVEVVTWRGLVRYCVLFVIDLKSRRVELASLSRLPYGQWMTQLARNLTDCESGFLGNARYLIHDRDPPFTKEFSNRLEISGLRPLKLPARSPNLNHRTTDSGTAPPFVLPISDAGELFLVGNADLHIGVDHAPTGQEVSFVDESLIQSHL